MISSLNVTFRYCSRPFIIYFERDITLSSVTFESLDLHPSILKAVAEAGYINPTPIQAQAIPAVLEGRDILASAQTGTGKTAGFTLPALNLLATPHESNSRGPRILVLVPTRELAAQVNESARKYGKFIRARTVSIVGGMPYPLQNKLLSQPLDILVATPGRFIDHMERGRIDLSRLQMLILDEADRMLDMGFMPDVQKICAALPESRQTLLFSATLDGNIGRIARDILKDPLTIEVAAQKEKHENIEQRLHHVDDMTHKNKLLEHLLIEPDVNQAIIFTSTKRHADLLAEDLYAAGHKTAALHGDMTQGARNRTLTKLRHGDIKVLVATDVAARGIDVKGISHVINYDLPKFAEDYVHRIGRTGRAGQKGIAIAFAGNMDRHVLRKIEQYTGQRLEATVIEGFEPKRPINMNAPDGKRGKGRGGRSGNSNNRSGGGYKGRSDNYKGRNDSGRNFGDRNASGRSDDRDRNDSSNGRSFGDRAAAGRDGGDRGRHDAPRNNSARNEGRNFGDRAAAGRPSRGNSNESRSERPARTRAPRNNDRGGAEVNGNSVNYKKDTNLQFAKEVARGSGNGRNSGANRGSAKISNEKFGKPRPQRSNGNTAGNTAPRRGNNDSARRSRDFS
ncbi:MAG: DEAD/DEAH box helicase [Methylophilaceae bacterium]|jgi:superfamily II DNA/RNA helicase